MADRPAPLYFFKSRNGWTLLSYRKPPEDYPIDGVVSEVGELRLLHEERPIPCLNWQSEEPAVLFRKPGTNDFAIGFPGDATPPGHERLGSDFGFIIDERNYSLATDAAR